jgi:PKD repeat protein
MSTDAGKTWKSRDGNIADMPIWGILLNPRKLGEAIIATELGIYGTSDVFAASVVWAPYNDGMGAVKVANLRYRDADQTIMATTHGRGVFTSDAWSKASPIVKFGISNDTVCSQETLTFKDSTLNSPTAWSWSFSPRSGIVYRNGTDSTKQNPVVQFTRGGTYSVTLTASNAIGEDQLSKINRIFVIDSIPLTISIQTNPAVVCVNDTFSLTSTVNANGKTIVAAYSWNKNGTTLANTNAHLHGLTPNTADKYQLFVQSTTRCVTPNPAQSAIVSPNTKGIKTITVSCNMDTLKAVPLGSGTYNWFKNGVKVGTGQKFKPSETGLYRCVYDDNGCKSDSSAIIILKSIDSRNLAVEAVSVYPNPAKGQFSIQGLSELGEIRIFNAVGQLIKAILVANGQSTLDVDIHGWVAGLYYVECYNVSGSQIDKQILVVE